MAHCVICDKDFANKDSLRSHRYKYHKVPKDLTDEEEDAQLSSQETTEKDSQQLKYDQNSQSTVEDPDEEDTDEEAATSDELHRDTLSSKRKHSDIDEENPSKNRHIYKKLSNIHDILKNHLDDGKTIFSVPECYGIKQMIDSLVPGAFDTDRVMKEVLTGEQFLYVTKTRELQTLSDICLAINDKEGREILLDVVEISKKK